MSEPRKVYQAIGAVSAALAKQGIAKDSQNAQQGYRFRGIDAVYNALAPLLAEHRLCILPRCLEREVTERTTQKGGVLFSVVVRVEFDLVSTDDGSTHTVTMYGEAMDSGDKATNKAMSAAYKYMAMEVFCIPTEGDNDADATTHEPLAPTPPRTRRPNWVSPSTGEIVLPGAAKKWDGHGGKAINDRSVPTEVLTACRDWFKGKDAEPEFVEALNQELEERRVLDAE